MAVCDRFFDHLQRRTFPGGCFFASAVLEMGTRPGPVKERVGQFQQRFVGLMFGFAAKAQELGQLAADEDLMLLVFELNGIILAANADFVMAEDATALDIARRAVRRRLSPRTPYGTSEPGPTQRPARHQRPRQPRARCHHTRLKGGSCQKSRRYLTGLSAHHG